MPLVYSHPVSHHPLVWVLNFTVGESALNRLLTARAWGLEDWGRYTLDKD